LAERYLEKYRGSIRVVVARPTMITSCYKEPLPGWIDTITAVGGVGYPFGMGLARTVYLPNSTLDFIPADLVSNSILVSIAYSASLFRAEFLIYHIGSSTSNPFKVHDFFSASKQYIKFNPYDKQIREPRWMPLVDLKAYKSLTYVSEDLPADILEKIASLPFVGSRTQL
jgi:fatty acyl-CoA reductase